MTIAALAVIVRLAIALVWLGNGLVAKVLGLVPRHEEIVAQILGPSDEISALSGTFVAC